MFMAVGMANAGPLKLTNTQLDMVTAGDLKLPSGVIVFEGFTNQGTGEPHPAFQSGNTTGPWNAHFNSPVIDL
jgi:hypothetical protein